MTVFRVLKPFLWRYMLMEDMIELIKSNWVYVKSYLIDKFGISEELSYDTWIKPLIIDRIVKDEKGRETLYFIGRDKMFCNIVNKKYAHPLSIAIEHVTNKKYDVKIEIKKAVKRTSIINSKRSLLNRSKTNDSNLNSKYTFNNFVVGKSNTMAHAASLAVAESPGEIYNPLFIYGDSGLGKTHLMQSIAHFILSNDEKAKVVYETSETFTNELIDSLANINKFSMNDFRKKYRQNDLLLIDDIQFIIGKERTLEEFFNTFNDYLYKYKKQIVISSDRPPKDFLTLGNRVKSRFESGLIVDINPPDYETRMAILRKKEETDNLNIDNAVMQYIATNIKENIRQLEGALNKVSAKGRLEKRDIDLELAKEALKDLISPDEPRVINVEFIKQIVSEHFEISMEDLLKKTRAASITYPRHVAMYLCRRLTDEPLKNIGAAFGGKDHTTVMNAVNSIEDKMKKNPEVKNTVEVISKKLSPQ